MKNIKLEKKIMQIVKQYQPILLLQRNTFELKYGTENPKAYMECLFNYPYLNVTLHYSDEFIKKYKENEDITPYVVHELCHVITDPFYAKATDRYVSKGEVFDERELLTDYICNIIIINKIRPKV